MNEHLLQTIDSIEETIVESEVSVLNSLHDLYEKTYMFLEYCESTDENYQFIQESLFMEADEEKKPSKIMTILKAIGTAIMSFIRSIASKIKGFFNKRKREKFNMLLNDYFINGENSVLVDICYRKGWEIARYGNTTGIGIYKNVFGRSKCLFSVQVQNYGDSVDNENYYIRTKGASTQHERDNVSTSARDLMTDIMIPVSVAKLKHYLEQVRALFSDIVSGKLQLDKLDSKLETNLSDLARLGEIIIEDFGKNENQTDDTMHIDEFGDIFTYLEKISSDIQHLSQTPTLVNSISQHNNASAIPVQFIHRQIATILTNISEMTNAACTLMSFSNEITGTFGIGGFSPFTSTMIQDNTFKPRKSSLVIENISSIITKNSYRSSPIGYNLNEITQMNYNNPWVQPDKDFDYNKYKLIGLFMDHMCFDNVCFGKLPNSNKWFVTIPSITCPADGSETYYKNAPSDYSKLDSIYNNYTFICNNKNTCEVLASFFGNQPMAFLIKLFTGVCHPFDEVEANGQGPIETNTSHILIDMSKMHAILDTVLTKSTNLAKTKVEDDRVYFRTDQPRTCAETLNRYGFDSELREEKSQKSLYSVNIIR